MYLALESPIEILLEPLVIALKASVPIIMLEFPEFIYLSELPPIAIFLFPFKFPLAIALVHKATFHSPILKQFKALTQFEKSRGKSVLDLIEKNKCKITLACD